MADSPNAQNNATLIAVSVIVVLVLAVAASMYRSKTTEEITPTPAVTGDTSDGRMMASTTVPMGTGSEATGTTMMPPVGQVMGMVVTSSTVSAYKDGTYGADGEYVSPAGQEHVGVTVTLKNDVVTDVTFEPRATVSTSVRFQGMFASGYKIFVVGKKIDDVRLDKVSGSSLTSTGFNDAIDQVKAAAQG